MYSDRELVEAALSFIDANSDRGGPFWAGTELSYFLDPANSEYDALVALLRHVHELGVRVGEGMASG